MLENTLKQIQESLKEKKIINDEESILLKEFLKDYEKNEYIYPGMIISKLKISSRKAYEILATIEKQGIVTKSYEEYCSKCGKVNGKIHDSFELIPDKMYCKYCGDRLDPIDDTIVIYRVTV